MAKGIHCPACGKNYPFKPELAGRKVKCRCGYVIAVPEQMPQPAGQIDDSGGLYDLAPDADATAKQSAAARQTVMPREEDDGGGATCPACQSQLAAGSVICINCGFNLKTGEKMKGIGGGDGGAVVAAGGKKKSKSAAPTRFAGIPPGLSAKKVEEEPKSAAFLKIGLAAVAVLLIVGVIFAMKYVGRDPDAGKPALDPDDPAVAKSLKEDFPKEAKEWLAIDESWMMGGWNKRQAEAKIEEWYRLGAKKVYCFGTRRAMVVGLELPEDAEKRKALFEWQAKWHREMFERVRTDKGQKYMIITLPM